ncbi:MAG: class I SAM-dependent methyltransferase [Actinomycetota bacterium]
MNARPSPRAWDDPAHAVRYLDGGVDVPHRAEGESELVESLQAPVDRVLDLGCGDGRLLAVVLAAHPGASGLALDHNPTMLDAATERFHRSQTVEVVNHDFELPLPDSLGRFDAIVSALAIHHLELDRRLDLYHEVLGLLRPGGVFADLDLVRSGSEVLHDRFIELVWWDREANSSWDRHPSLEQRHAWLVDTGFRNVDCTWKWRELALVVGEAPMTKETP